MKKITAILVMVAMLFSFAACNNTEATSSVGASSNNVESNTETSSTEATGGALKTGMAVVTSNSKSKAATEDKDGTAQVDSVLAGVVLGADGKIVACKIDSVQGKVAFNAKGELVTEAGTEFKTKKELGNDYNMKGSSGIGKEWFEQIAVFEQYVIGKTAAEVKAIPVDETSVPTGDDLKAGCTIKVADYIAAVSAACENATEAGAADGDELRIAIKAVASTSSKNATADADGVARVDISYSVVTVNGDKVTSCKLDELQAKVPLKADGTLGEAALKTKKELGNDYNMKGKSGIGKEWFEQIDVLEKFISGSYDKMELTEDGYAANDDLKAGCTINISGEKAIVEKAIANK